jgi:hypothetical protein
MGTGEEASELADLDLSGAPTEEELDAIGDILVFGADYCVRRGLDYQAAYEQAQTMVPVHQNFWREWTAARGNIERSVLKTDQGIRLDEDRVGVEAEQMFLARLLCAVDEFVTERGYTLADAARCAWDDEVIDREWDSSYN